MITGSWDAIGADSRGVNSANLSFTTAAANQTVDFWINALNGSIKVDVLAVPVPSTLALLDCAVAGLFCLRRRQ